jgi:hypothetical protein
MATITKSGARKPLAEGVVCAGSTVRWVQSERPGFLHGIPLIAIVVHDPSDRREYRLEMNRLEAMQVVAQLAEQLLATEPKVEERS